MAVEEKEKTTSYVWSDSNIDTFLYFFYIALAVFVLWGSM